MSKGDRKVGAMNLEEYIEGQGRDNGAQRKDAVIYSFTIAISAQKRSGFFSWGSAEHSER